MESIPFFRTWLAKTIGHANDKCSSGSGCKATDPHGPRVRAGADCVFPFKYRGVLHSACTLSGDHKQPWCSTTTDDNYEHKSGTWATCALSCPTEVSKIKLVGGKNEWEGNIMVGGKPVCDDGAKDYGDAVAHVVCRFILLWPKTNIWGDLLRSVPFIMWGHLSVNFVQTFDASILDTNPQQHFK